MLARLDAGARVGEDGERSRRRPSRAAWDVGEEGGAREEDDEGADAAAAIRASGTRPTVGENDGEERLERVTTRSNFVDQTIRPILRNHLVQHLHSIFLGGGWFHPPVV